ncbi:hypothetical protein OESDEN_12959 [Oesophagostomum dentatum]|uniref:Major facilitator superfamily (MFS) profile domain-containing protein n=1 Tax=Oesophagostomum dentatum TaxID=61180 RepID=A0A0B1SVQ6_OESDE|nr:hypothetical protein OESDEN_12959 [Oesophagostomum dentatum]
MPYVQPNPMLECIYKNQTIVIDANCRIVPSHNISAQGVCGVVKDTELIVKDPYYSTSLITEYGISCSSFLWKEAGLTAFTLEPKWFFLVFVLIGKVFNSVTYDVHALYVAEMSPTSVRSLFYSMINLSQSIGIILAPYLRHVTIGSDNMKYVITGVLCIISGALCYFLPETKDRPLPADIKAASHRKRGRSKQKRDTAAVFLNGHSNEEAPRIFQEN